MNERRKLKIKNEEEWMNEWIRKLERKNKRRKMNEEGVMNEWMKMNTEKKE